MFVVKISSGFGNQLFQYAFALYLKKEGCQDVRLDTSAFKYYTSTRACGIDLISELPMVKDRRIYYRYRSIFFNIGKFFFQLNPFVKLVTEKTLKLPLKGRFVYFDGFWQTDKYINQLGDWETCFHPKENVPDYIDKLAASMENRNTISLHVRRGDYFSEDHINWYGVCDVAYYEKAINQLSEGKPDCKIFVFSDEPEWVKANLHLPVDHVFVENETIHPYWLIWLMSRCRDHIISNSSFSWWGAYMGKHPEKRVIAPKVWMKGHPET
ncbi:MAG: alpha-1,2-fucosyltransferase, partial [Bacteroidia bacterium]|nr:alpha-1,2-fucosyltransferase [Bacteroidia bacterium]